jgi:hypothetical protein
MRERDMRLRVERFMQTRLRNMLMPATLGLGLALGGCAGDGLSADDGGDKKDVAADTGTVAKYMAQAPDTAPPPVPMYGVVAPKDAGPELPVAQPDYMAQVPDSGMVVRYMAVMPDAGPDLGMVALYLAQVPNPQG